MHYIAKRVVRVEITEIFDEEVLALTTAGALIQYRDFNN